MLPFECQAKQRDKVAIQDAKFSNRCIDLLGVGSVEIVVAVCIAFVCYSVNFVAVSSID